MWRVKRKILNVRKTSHNESARLNCNVRILSLNKIPYSLISVLFDDERAPQVCSDVIVRSYRTGARANLLSRRSGLQQLHFRAKYSFQAIWQNNTVAATQGKTQQAPTKFISLQKSIQYKTYYTQYIIYTDIHTIINMANEAKEKEKLSERSVTV